ncbi:MAG TPA: hypothetical protein VF178_10975 [Gemmatimonadaceae bacterium]
MPNAPTPDPHALAREALALSKKATPPPWYAEDSEDVWQLFAAHRVGGVEIHPWQLAKCPKQDTPFAEYWPKPEDSEFIIRARELLPVLARAVLAAPAPGGEAEERERLAQCRRELPDTSGKELRRFADFLRGDNYSDDTVRRLHDIAAFMDRCAAPAREEEEIAAAWREYDEAVEQARYTNRYVTPATKDAAKQALARVERLRGLLRALLSGTGSTEEATNG